MPCCSKGSDGPSMTISLRLSVGSAKCSIGWFWQCLGIFKRAVQVICLYRWLWTLWGCIPLWVYKFIIIWLRWVDGGIRVIAIMRLPDFGKMRVVVWGKRFAAIKRLFVATILWVCFAQFSTIFLNCRLAEWPIWAVLSLALFLLPHPSILLFLTWVSIFPLLRLNLSSIPLPSVHPLRSLRDSWLHWILSSIYQFQLSESQYSFDDFQSAFQISWHTFPVNCFFQLDQQLLLFISLALFRATLSYRAVNCLLGQKDAIIP